MHQPLGLMEPSTTLHVPFLLGELPGMNWVHVEHFCPFLGVL
jgi:hypothetical protein